MAPSCVIVFPIYNEAGCIRQVCQEWLDLAARYAGFRVLAVDDGSKDGTPEILKSIAEENPLFTVIQQANAGHGPSIRRAYQAAVDMNSAWVFQIDSDRQFLPDDFEQLWKRRTESSFILGDRAHRNDHGVRIFLSHVHRLILAGIFGISVRDPNVPYRLMRGSFLAEMLRLIPAGAFAPNVMLTLLARKAGEDLLHVPVSHHARVTGTVSINGPKILKIGLRWFTELLRFRFRGFAAFQGIAKERASMVDLV